MKLVRLEIRNYRSILDQTEENAIVFGGTDCLVGMNNAGKSNILKAIRYLLDNERVDEDLHYGRDTSCVIDVRGYFEVVESDFTLLKIEAKRESIRSLTLDDGTIGICRRSNGNDLEVIRYYPEEERLREKTFTEFHSRAWEEQQQTDYRERMQSEYPELQEHVAEGKESNKGAWKDAYSAFLSSRPDGIQFVAMPGPAPTGIPADLTNMLPRVIFVPAVKEVADATKTTRSSEFGRLLAELSTQVQAEFDEAIRESMEAVYARLNVIFDPETDRSVDGRDPRVQAIERQITDYTAETFQDVSVRLEFPTPESRVMFDNARVWIHEQGFGDVPVDQSGEGVKRVLIFSLFRTLADLRQGKLSLSDPHPDEEVPAESYPPLLILYEEAELFLHPGLQRTLLRAFSDLRDSGAQVIYTTHSPFMLQGKWLSSISLVSKIPLAGTQVTGFHTKLSSMAPKDMNLLLQVQNVSSYMFADRVLLVEGESDRIVLSKLAPALHPEWDFAKRGIPILSVAGKGNLPLFRGFLLSLGIETYVVTDIDSVKAVLLKLCTSTCVRESQSKLLQVCDDLIESGSVATKFNKREVSKLVSSYNWNQVFDSLEELYEAYRDGQAPAEEQIDCLRRLVSSRAEAARTTALVSDHHDIVRIRTELAKLLLGEGIMLLSGTIEDYYPSDGGNKIERALQFDPQKFSKSELQSHFVNLPDTGTTDMQAFLSKVFGTP